MGDPAGCGPIITPAAIAAARAVTERPIFVIGDPQLYAGMAEVRTISSPKDAASIKKKFLAVMPLELPQQPVLGEPNGIFAQAILQSIDAATQQALNGEIAAMVTNPINKAVLYGAGFLHPGHTEYIAYLCNSHTNRRQEPVMMLVGGGLKVALATIHIPLREAPDALHTAALVTLAQSVDASLREDFRIDTPRIAFCGLNPHAGESGAIGVEEIEIINPAANVLREMGVRISDARPADTVFAEALSGQFDAVIAMTHDQGLIPVKTLDFWGGVNTTLGLPIIRTSPDHGTAYDASREGTCRPDSLITAIKLADQMAQSRFGE